MTVFSMLGSECTDRAQEVKGRMAAMALSAPELTESQGLAPG